MRLRYLSGLSLILLFASVSVAYSQSQPPSLQFRFLTADEGLSSSDASAILQDHKGLMWIGTTDGLNSYDGFNFTTYRNIAGDSLSLINNVVRTIFNDHNNNLFIGTERGLSLYDRKMNKFVNYFLDKSSPLRGINCAVSRIEEDSLGNLWLATNAGLIYFNRSSNTIRHYLHDPDLPESLSNNNVESVIIDRSGLVWIATRKGLNLFQPSTGTFSHFKKPFGKVVLDDEILTRIIEDSRGNLWLGGPDGLLCLKKGKTGEITDVFHYQHDDKNKSSLSINQVSALFIDNDSNLWVGTENGGLNLFNRVMNSFWHYRTDDYDPRSLNNESIETIFQDRSGNLWIGTFTGGINITRSHSNSIFNYQVLSGAPFSLSHNSVTSFSEESDGTILLGTDGGGIDNFDKTEGQFSKMVKSNSGITSNAVLCLLKDSNDIVWIGTWAGGFLKYDLKTNHFTSFTSKNSSLPDDNIYSIAKGEANDLWLGSFEHGLLHYNINEKKFKSFTLENSDLRDNMVVKIQNFSNHRLLIGTTSGFQIYSLTSGKFLNYENDPEDSNSLSFSRVTDIVVENDSIAWIGTPDGLNRFNSNTGHFKHFFEKDGLPNNFVKGIVFDNSGSLWVTTNKGICKFDYKTRSFWNFDKADGLQGNEFNERSIFKTIDGELLMGGTNGFNLIKPEKLVENRIVPDVIITDLKLLNEKAKSGEINSALKENITETKSLIFSPRQYIITFNFAVMDFTAPEKNQYAYKLENFDDDWVFCDKRREVTYTNLNPGDYTFRVKGSNNDGVWNDLGTSISIKVLPPWWKTLWFKLTAIIAFLISLTLVYRLRILNLKKQQLRLENQVELKTHELLAINASKDKFFSIIAHDLKNPFNTIIGFSELQSEYIEKGDFLKTQEFAQKINLSAIQTLRLLENLLEWAKAQTGKIQFNPVRLSLNQIFTEEYDILYELAQVKKIELIDQIPEDLYIYADRNMIKAILRNLMTNAIKFTSQSGKVLIKAIIENNYVVISVVDSGIGMTKKTIARLFKIDEDLSTPGTENEKGTGLGLLLCKEFVDIHGGEIMVESIVSRGSTFTVLLPNTSGNKP